MSRDKPQATPEQRADRLLGSYKPVNERKFRAMKTIFADADSPEMLDKLILLYLPDMSYARPDIATAGKYARILKGWP